VLSLTLHTQLVRLMVNAGCRVSFDLESAGMPKQDDRREHGDVWRVVYSDVDDDVEPILRARATSGAAHQLRRVTGYAQRTWCFDMSSAAGESDGFVIVRRATRERKTDYDARVHAVARTERRQQVNIDSLPGVSRKKAIDAKWVVTHASVPTIQGSCVTYRVSLHVKTDVCVHRLRDGQASDGRHWTESARAARHCALLARVSAGAMCGAACAVVTCVRTR
jgi:hypothetical protein